MQLAADEITITVGGERVHLRPTLRAAFRLERRHGGFDKIMKAILQGSLTMTLPLALTACVQTAVLYSKLLCLAR